MLRAGDVALDLRTHRASVGDKVVELTAREFALAETFLCPRAGCCPASSRPESGG